MHSVDFDSIEWVSGAPGVRQKVFVSGNQRMRLVEFSEGFTEPDWCRRGHAGYVLDGELDVRFPNGMEHFSKGDFFFIPEGEEHRHMVCMGEGGWVRLLLVEVV